jgi:hypothetical protein
MRRDVDGKFSGETSIRAPLDQGCGDEGIMWSNASIDDEAFSFHRELDRRSAGPSKTD